MAVRWSGLFSAGIVVAVVLVVLVVVAVVLVVLVVAVLLTVVVLVDVVLALQHGTFACLTGTCTTVVNHRKCLEQHAKKRQGEPSKSNR